MGLDFNPGEAHFSYSGFMRFRIKLAKEININLDEMIGFGGNKEWKTINDDIVKLLNHSDCAGYLTPKQCAKIAPRLIELVSKWPTDDWDKNQALILAEDMLNASAANVKLQFC